MEFSVFSLFSLALSLFILMGPVGNIPIYISVLKKIPPARQRFVIIRELLIALIVIVLFMFLGKQLLYIIGVDGETTSIAGGIVLFIIAIKMIFPKGRDPFEESDEQGEPLIVPLAIPLVAGPSILAAVIIYSEKGSQLFLLTAILIAWLFSTLILLSSSFLKRVLGSGGISACEKLMGLILIMMGIQMFLEGLILFFKSRGCLFS